MTRAWNAAGIRLPDLIREHALERGKPLLGICLGMQLLGQNSQEGTLPGLGLLPFSCKRFDFPPETALKIPHMAGTGPTCASKRR